MNSTDTIQFEKLGFDNQKYISLQQEAIRERIKNFKGGKLYLEIGGKFLHDPHASRVLPGFEPDVKVRIFRDLNIDYEILFCVNAEDIQDNRMLTNKDVGYWDYTFSMIEEYKSKLKKNIVVVVNLIDEGNAKIADKYIEKVNILGFKAIRRYVIYGYPDSKSILSKEGYGKDEHYNSDKDLVLVMGAASNSGKMSTCLGQIYHDSLNNKKSGYAKYETFPIWNLPLNHPVNLAYEAATVDIGDYNMLDIYHKKAYGIDSVNYNRDIAAFKIVKDISLKIVTQDNYMHRYLSPTDMGISNAGFAITDDKIVCIAAIDEINRRKEWLREQVKRKQAESKWIDICDSLLRKAELYCKSKGYSILIP